MTHPILFVSHGAPDILLNPGATGAMWADLGQQLPKPSAILVVSAHWETKTPTISAAAQPDTLHDFGGFPRSLYAIRYPAPGTVDLAGRVASLFNHAGLPIRVSANRGLDHGAWVPLRLIYPDADIPVCQLSVQPTAGTAWHRDLGRILRPLRDEGVLILASGSVTHNFGWLTAPGSPPFAPAVEFTHWLGRAITGHRDDDLLAYRDRAPHGAAAHPTEEHLLPLFVAWGMADPDDSVTWRTPEYTYGGLAMTACLWQRDT